MQSYGIILPLSQLSCVCLSDCINLRPSVQSGPDAHVSSLPHFNIRIIFLCYWWYIDTYLTKCTGGIDLTPWNILLRNFCVLKVYKDIWIFFGGGGIFFFKFYKLIVWQYVMLCGRVPAANAPRMHCILRLIVQTLVFSRSYLHRQVSALNVRHETNVFTSLPKKGVLRIFCPEKSDSFGRVWTRELGYQRPARYL